MKRLLSLVLFSSLFFGLAQAYSGWFAVSAQCQLNNAHAYCFIENNGFDTMYCELKAQGRSYRGYWANVVNNGWVAGGQYMYATVYANNPHNDPIVIANATARCRY